MGGMATRTALLGRVAFKYDACKLAKAFHAAAHGCDRHGDEALHQLLEEVKRVMREHVGNITTACGLLPRGMMLESCAQMLE
jgi:hypothetical protein